MTDTQARQNMIAAILEVKDEFGIDFARAIVEEHTRPGGKVAEIVPERYETVTAAARQKYKDLLALRTAD